MFSILIFLWLKLLIRQGSKNTPVFTTLNLLKLMENAGHVKEPARITAISGQKSRVDKVHY